MFYRFIIFSLLLFNLSCVEEYQENFIEDINLNPNEFSNSPADLLIGSSDAAVVLVSESNISRICAVWSR